ncbi:flagellar hook-length control protein FliK [Ferrovibrio sp.]|uniref:flagellar hook-length control protein FliK n=1 Tax=Ferrovibrio sp. TaxID=1917215 RepID=UPI003D29D7AB
MQIGSVNANTQIAIGQADAGAADDFKAAKAFANVLATAFSSGAKQHTELKGPEAAAPAERPRQPEPKADTYQPQESRQNDEARAADHAADKAKLKDEPKQKPAMSKADEQPVSEDSAAKTAAPAESQAAEATDKTGATPEQAESEGKDKEKQAAEAAVDPNLILNLFIPAAQAAVSAQAGTAFQNGTQNGAQAGVAVDGKNAAQATAADAALQQMQASVLSPEAQQQMLEAAKQAAMGQGNGKAGKIDVQTVANGNAPAPLVDPAAMFADLLAQQEGMMGEGLDGQAQLGADLQAAKLENQALLNANFALALEPAPASSPAAEAAKGSNNSLTGIGATASGQSQPVNAGHVAQAQAARHPSAIVPPGEQVAVQIKKAVAEGADKISIKLDPGNLGKVEVTLEVSQDGRLMAVIAADKPETLQLLQKDAGALEQALRESGMKANQDSLNFQLRDQGQDGRGFAGNEQGRRGYGRGGDEYGDAGAVGGDARLAAQAANTQRAAARGGLDIRI